MLVAAKLQARNMEAGNEVNCLEDGSTAGVLIPAELQAQAGTEERPAQGST